MNRHARLGVARWWWAPYPALRLARLRMLVGLFATVYLAARLPSLLATTRMSAASFAPVGPLSWMSVPAPTIVVPTMMALTVALGVAFVFGWRYRISAPAFAGGCLLLFTYRSSWSMVFHTDNLLAMHVLILASCPAADTASLDAKAGRTFVRERLVVRGYYGWPVQLLCVATVVTYVVAGYAKLDHIGIEWCLGDTLRQQIAYDNVRKLLAGAPHAPWGLAVISHTWLMATLATATLVLELGAPIALLHRRAGYVWCAAAWSFHAGVLALMAILFTYPVLGFAYLSFFPVERWRWPRRLSARFGRAT